ncbi:unnamed protein product [Cunninghamella echinulata]
MAHISEIYKRATYILAIPDLHYAYLQENPANTYLLDSIEKNWRTIYIGILNNYQPVDEEETQDIRHAYSFLEFLICDWSNRAWVISQIHIAKEKQENHGTPLKYMFMSLLHPEVSTFFSYLFDHQPTTVNTDNNVNNIDIYNVDSSSKFIQLLKARLSQRQYIDMLLNSRAIKNEDRFNAILPIWKKYKHVIKDKNTISSWNITNMTSVRLKLYEIMDDLWDKARLLYACSKLIDLPTFPSYANRHRGDLLLIEKDAVDIAYKEYSTTLSECAIKKFGNDDCVQQVIMNCGLIYTENLIDVQLNPRHHYLSVRAKKYFVSSNDSMPDIDLSYLSRHSLEKESLVCIYIPFFTFAIPGFTDVSHKSGSFIQLIGNYNQNRWMIFLPNFDPSQIGLKLLKIKLKNFGSTGNGIESSEISVESIKSILKL